MTEQTPVQKLTASVVDYLTSAVNRSDRDLATFKANLDRNPVYAFEWAQAAIEAAATKEACYVLLNIVHLKLNTPEESAAHGGPFNAIRWAIRETIRGARSPQHSTSTPSNLVAEAKTAAYADFADRFQTRLALETN